MKRLHVTALGISLFSMMLLLRAAPAHGFACLMINGRCVRWTQGAATLRSFLGNPGTALLNGTFTWDQNAVNAANDWNGVGAAFHFTVDVGGDYFDPCGPQGPGHACPNTGPPGDNPVLFASSFCGQGFGDIIELTNNCADRNSGAMLNAPVFVNSTVDWNAYDGPLHVSGGHVVHDIRRVLVHEFGHVLGLDHPDENGQNVTAIMNSRESNIDRLQPDDVAGIFSIYPNGGGGASTGCQMQRIEAGERTWVLLLPVSLLVLRFRRRRFGRSQRTLGSAFPPSS